MKITLNGKEKIVTASTLFELRDSLFDSSCITIYEGFQTSEDKELKEGCNVAIIKKGVMPSSDELEALMTARHSPKLHHRFKKTEVAIAGLGGLGSNIAIMLARSGVGRLMLIDFDTVEPSNLNRQQYFISQLGMYKTDALKQTLEQINPYIQVDTKNLKVKENNIEEIFSPFKLICEAFDNPDSKAMLVNYVLEKLPDTYIVASSGMAGIESSNSIKTTRPMERLYICGDGVTSADYGTGLMAPRAAICAAHQANMILRLINEIYEP